MTTAEIIQHLRGYELSNMDWYGGIMLAAADRLAAQEETIAKVRAWAEKDCYNHWARGEVLAILADTEAVKP